MDYKINIDNYLSEEDKVEIAENLFKEELRKGFLETQSGKRIENYERVVNNAVHHWLDNNVDQVIGKDFKADLEVKVKAILKRDLTYHVFRSPSPWGKEESVAQKMMDEIVLENRDLAVKRVTKALNNINTEKIDTEFVSDLLREIIEERLKYHP